MDRRDLFLPVNQADLTKRSIRELDVIIVSGDAYVDHPAFAAALLGRLLESNGYKVGILAQPDLKTPGSLAILGRPRLCFLVSAGAMDSMVNHYTAAHKPRKDDAYSPGGISGKRPDRAIIHYVNALKAAHKGSRIIIGGIEASLRRLTHFDYWSQTIKRSILMDSKADLLVYGMGERQILEIVDRLNKEGCDADLAGIRGTVRQVGKPPSDTKGAVLLPAFEEQKADKVQYAKAWQLQSIQTDPVRGQRVIEPEKSDGTGRWLIQESPAALVDQKLLDSIYELPYTRTWHPDYDSAGGVPALEEVQFSLVSSRGCFGSCSFCALTFHQGRIIQSRSKTSLIREATILTQLAGFKGYIHDLGGPTANFRSPACSKQATHGACANRQCLSPDPCASLEVSHKEYLDILRTLRAIPGIKKVFIRSGIRFDYLMLDPDRTFFEELCEHHISGRLKVAPEHVSDKVLALMGKPANTVYQSFVKTFDAIESTLAARQNRPKQQVIPYFISSHPGCTLADAIELAVYLKRTGFIPDSVQDFYPTPGSKSTVMYYTGLDPQDLTPVFVARGEREKAMQRALLQFDRPENAKLVKEALALAGRNDLIGKGPDCLLRY